MCLKSQCGSSIYTWLKVSRCGGDPSMERTWSGVPRPRKSRQPVMSRSRWRVYITTNPTLQQRGFRQCERSPEKLLTSSPQGTEQHSWRLSIQRLEKERLWENNATFATAPESFMTSRFVLRLLSPQVAGPPVHCEAKKAACLRLRHALCISGGGRPTMEKFALLTHSNVELPYWKKSFVFHPSPLHSKVQVVKPFIWVCEAQLGMITGAFCETEASIASVWLLNGLAMRRRRKKIRARFSRLLGSLEARMLAACAVRTTLHTEFTSCEYKKRRKKQSRRVLSKL